MYRRFIVAFFALLFPLAALAAPAFSVAVPTLAAPPSMSGIVDPSWAKAVQLPVLFDFTYQRDGEPTTVYVAQDASAIDLAFVVTQREAITENTETNGTGVLSDDNVSVVFWPQGAHGFSYTFTANARGARYQTSSENSVYSPQWTAVGRRTPSGYVVTMRIPLRVIRSGGSTAWRTQFERVIQSTNSVEVWEHVQGQSSADEQAYAGTLLNIGAHGAAQAARPQPRLQVYALGEITNAANGASTSRVGADLALPVTPTSSFLASLHPDYSNVEIDQQSIAPSAFPRFYSEVRPFFAQLSQHYNNLVACFNCPTLLYTPAIPTFRQGYAYEGTQGPLSFAAFDTAGFERTDDAQALTYRLSDRTKSETLSLQRVNVDLPGFVDDTTSITSGYEWQKSHDVVYFNGAQDRGTGVTVPGLGNYVEFGALHAGKDSTYGVTYQKIGAQFAPADGFVQQSDVAGFGGLYQRVVHFGPKKTLQDIQISNFLDEQNNGSGESAAKVDSAQVNFDFLHELTLHVYGGYAKNRTFNGEYLPFNQNGAFVGYKTQTTTPSSVMFAGGSYYHGSLGSWSYITTLPIAKNVRLALESDENTYTPLGAYAAEESSARQWLERASIDWQFSRFASFDVGLRRIVGRNLPNAYQPPDPAIAGGSCGTLNGYLPFDCVNAGNVSAAFHFLAAHNEWYAVYGNPNDLSTLPAFYIKWIRYIGAEKGT